MKCIQTKYLDVTENQGSRIKAWVDGTKFSVIIPYDYSMDIPELHFKAAKALVEKHELDWDISEMVLGYIGGGYVFCFPQSIIKA